MNTHNNHAAGLFARLRRNKLAYAISVVIAGLFQANVAEAQARGSKPLSSLALDIDQLPAVSNPPPYYLQIALQAVQTAPQAFLLGATVSTAGGVGVGTSGTHDDESIVLRAANSTGVQALAGSVISFDRGTVDSASTTAATASGQRGLHVADGGVIEARAARVSLVPLNTSNVAITANNLTGAAAERGGKLDLTDAAVTLGGGASGSNNIGLLARDAGSRVDFSGGSVSTVSKGSRGVLATDGGQVYLSAGTQVQTTGASSTTTASHGLHAEGVGSLISADRISVNTAAIGANAIRVDSTGQAQVVDSSLETLASNAAAVSVDGAGSQVQLSGGRIDTKGTGAVGVLANNGGTAQVQGTAINTQGGNSSATGSHGLSANGPGSAIAAQQLQITTSGNVAQGARATQGGQISLDTVQITTSAGSAHGLLAQGTESRIDGQGVKVAVAGSNTSAAKAEAGGAIALGNSQLVYRNLNDVKSNGTGVVHAETGASIALFGPNNSIEVTGAGMYGLYAKGAGAAIALENTDITMHGLAGGTANGLSHGVVANGGGAVSLADSRLTIKEDVWSASKGIYAYDPGSQVTLRNTDIISEKAAATGIYAQSQARVEVDGGSVTTHKDNTQGIRINGGVQDANAAPSTLIARNLRIDTHGNGESEGLVLNTGAQARLEGGSVTTHGEADLRAGTRSIGIALKPSFDASKPTTLWATGTNVHTYGSSAHGVGVDDGSVAYLDNLSVTTEGRSAHGLYSLVEWPGDQYVAGLWASNVNVRTLGDNAAGAMVKQDSVAVGERKSTLTLDNTSVTTLGANAPGLQAVNGGVLAATNSVVSTSGTGAHGVYSLSNEASGAGVPSLISLENVSSTSSGAQAHAAMAENDGHIDAERVTLYAAGADAAALALQGDSLHTPQARIADSVLRNVDGGTLSLHGPADVALSASSVGGSGHWLDVGAAANAAGQARVDVAGSVVTGSASTAAGSTSDVALRDTSIWRMTADSNLTQLSNSASLIAFSAPVGNAFKRLNVHSYAGNNGTIALNTHLFDDASPSDRLVVDGGLASGSTNLQINNAGGAGALTSGNGIMVVDAVNGGMTESQAFRLLDQVKAGPYEYTLHRASLDDSNDQAWYLRSTKDIPGPAPEPDPKPDPDPDPKPVPQPDPGPDIEPPVKPPVVPRQEPNYRPETSLYQGIPALALHYSRAMVDTLHERVGEERRRATVDPLLEENAQEYGPTLGWGRLIYRNGDDTLGNADYDYKMRAFQVGLDLYRSEDTQGRTNQAGLSLGIGTIDGSLHHSDGRLAGDDGLRAFSLGGYWTHYTPSGSYIDSVLLLHRFKAQAQPDGMDRLKTRGHGVTASVEVGRPFVLDHDKEFYIEPQAQVVYSKSRFEDAHDDAAKVRFDDIDSLTGRLGVRIDKDWFREDAKGKLQRTNVWVRPSVWHEFKSKPKTEFSSADGYIPFTNDMRGTWGEVNLGVDYEVNGRTTVTGSLGYQKAFDGKGRSYEGILGIKVKF